MPLENDGPKRRLRVFLCHSSADKEPVRKLCEWLERDGFEPWLDEKKLLPAQRWQDVIEDTVRLSDVVLVCLSKGSVSKEGYLQREIKFALQIADEKPDDTIYIVPTRLEPVELPRRFREFQAANLYDADGYEKLKQSLTLRADQIAVAPPLPTSEPHFLQITDPGSQTTTPLKTPRLLQWIKLHPRMVASALVLVLGATSFAGYRAYQQQKQQRRTADQFFKEAVSSWKALDLRKAESLFSQAAAAEPEDPMILASYALSLNERGNEEQARVIARRAVDNASRLPNNEKQMVEGIFNEVTANWGKAEEIYSRMWHRDHDLEHGIRLAHVQTLGGNPQKAIGTIEEIPAPGSDDPRVLLEKATAQKMLGRFDDAIKSLQRIISEHPDDDLVRATALADKCWAYYKSRDLKDPLKTAMDACREAADIFNDKEDALGQARTLTREALIISDGENQAPDFQRATELQKRAIEIAHERGATRDEAGGRQNLANILLQQTPPDPETARTEYERSKELFKNLNDKTGMAGVDNDQAVRLIDLCRYQDALNSAKQAGEIWHEIGSVDEAVALSNQGTMELFLGDLPSAESDLKSALSMSEGKLNVGRDNWLITLGEVYAAEGKLSLAEQCYKGGPCYNSREPSSIHNADILPDATVDYAALQIEQKNYSGAEELAQSALTKAKTENDPDGEAWARLVLANALLSQGKNALLNRSRDAVTGVASIGSKDCRVGVAAGLTLARIDGRSGNFDGQRETLTKVLQTAHNLGLLGYVFEATLDQAEMNLREGQSSAARQRAEEVQTESGNRGFQPLAERASSLIGRTKADRSN
jgi:tetratricopeptide (TPR) repeat protein